MWVVRRNDPAQRRRPRGVAIATATARRRYRMSHTQKPLSTMAEESRQGNRRLKAERTFHGQTFRCRHRLGSHERSVRRLNAPESPASKTQSPKTARRKRTQRTQSNSAKWSNDQRPGLRDAWIATGARWPGSLQRLVSLAIFPPRSLLRRYRTNNQPAAPCLWHRCLGLPCGYAEQCLHFRAIQNSRRLESKKACLFARTHKNLLRVRKAGSVDKAQPHTVRCCRD